MPSEMKDSGGGGSVARVSLTLLLPAIVLLAGCGPSVVEQREFPLCERAHFAVLKQVRNPDTGVTELVRQPPDKPQRWDVLCGMTGSGYLYSIRIADVYEDFRVLARDQPLRGKTITLDCYDRLPDRPEAVRWGKSAWLATDDRLYCRIPGEFMTAARR